MMEQLAIAIIVLFLIVGVLSFELYRANLVLKKFEKDISTIVDILHDRGRQK